MKLHIAYLLLAFTVTLLAATGTADAAYCKARSVVGHGSSGNPADIAGPNTDSGFNYAYAKAEADCQQTECSAFCDTFATAYGTAAGTFPSLTWKIVEKITKDDSKNTIPLDQYTHEAEADYQRLNGWLVVAGAIQDCKLALDNVGFKIPDGDPDAYTTINLDLTIDGAPEFSSSFTLSGDGTQSGTGGVYDPGNFTVTLDGGFWTAEYNGPVELPFTLPGNSEPFDLDFSIDSENVGGVGELDEYEVSLHLPGEIMPEPASVVLLGFGALLLGRRRRKNRA